MYNGDDEEVKFMDSLYHNPKYDEIKKENDKDNKIILAFISALLLDYTIEKEKLKLSTTQKAIAYKKVVDLINKLFGIQIKLQSLKVTEILKESLKSLQNFRFEQTSSVWKLSQTEIKKILDVIIEGKNYSDRIYDNKNKVAKLLKKQTKDLIDGKISVNEVKEIVQEKFNLNDSDTERLVENEISRVCRAADEQYFKDNIGSIKELVYNSVLDTNTCQKCADSNGTTYEVDEDRPSLPRHTRCKCFYTINYKKG